MKEMLMLLSASMTKKEIIERLTESCAQYNEANLLHNEESIKTAEQELFGLAGSTEARNQRKKLVGLEQASFAGKTGAAQGALGRERAGNL